MRDPSGARPAPAHDQTHYNAAIDGLRFFAIGSVLLFHLWPPFLPGGFVGVDVFFVISGYLITGMLARRADSPGLVEFYQNRIARIAPAALLVIAATLAAGYLIYDAQTFAYLGSSAAFAALSLINIKLLFQSSYFAASPDAQPLLHFWSLAVEEQFYLFYPALLLGIRRLRLSLPPVLAVIGLSSLALSLVLTATHPNWAFYLLPTRAWELCAGGWLAVRRQDREGPIRPPVGWAGMVLLAMSFALVSEGRGFPGWQALLPVTATMMMIAAAKRPGKFSAFLSARPFVAVGLVSYSLYLWHWPVFSLVDHVMYQQPRDSRIPVKIALTLALAIASYALVERPLRRHLRDRRLRTATFAMFFAATAVIAGAGIHIRSTYYLSAEGGSLERGGILVNPQGLTRVALVGDSEAAMHGTALRDAATGQHWRLRVLGAANTNQLPGEPDTNWALVARWLQHERPAVVVLAYAFEGKLKDGRSLDRALTAFAAQGARTVIVLEPPRPAAPSGYTPHADGRTMIAEANVSARTDTAARVRAIAARHGALVVDPAPLFLLPHGSIRIARAGKAPDFYDAAHLSHQGAQRVAPLIAAAVRAAASSRQLR